MAKAGRGNGRGGGGGGGRGGGGGGGRGNGCAKKERNAYTSRAYDRVFRATADRAKAKAAYKRAAQEYDTGRADWDK